MKVKLSSVSFVCFFCTLQFRVLNPNRRNNNRAAKIYTRGGIYKFERYERLLRGEY